MRRMNRSGQGGSLLRELQKCISRVRSGLGLRELPLSGCQWADSFSRPMRRSSLMEGCSLQSVRLALMSERLMSCRMNELYVGAYSRKSMISWRPRVVVAVCAGRDSGEKRWR